MRKTLMASVLLLVFIGSAHAGIVLTPPAPQPATAVQEPTTDGVIHTPLTTGGEIQNGAVTTFVQMVLNLLALS